MGMTTYVAIWGLFVCLCMLYGGLSIKISWGTRASTMQMNLFDVYFPLVDDSCTEWGKLFSPFPVLTHRLESWWKLILFWMLLPLLCTPFVYFTNYLCDNMLSKLIWKYYSKLKNPIVKPLILQSVYLMNEGRHLANHWAVTTGW